jgi:NAD(P) transhydrogenase subunit alpha
VLLSRTGFFGISSTGNQRCGARRKRGSFPHQTHTRSFQQAPLARFTAAIERRAAVDPVSTRKLIGLGLTVGVEAGLGEESGFRDAAYVEAGAQVVPSFAREAALREADVVVRVQRPPAREVPLMKRGSVHVSFLDPFNQRELLDAFVAAGASAVSLEMIPRTTLAQKMDAISSQASLAGYEAVILAASRLNRILPMMMTPAGTLAPAHVFVIGVGVAGLQAIATAKRLGARVEAFDTRPVVEEQVKSLGAKFVKIDLGATGQTAQGYAQELTAEQLDRQRAGMAKVCAHSDIVITTAKVFGRKAPLLVTREMVAGMKPDSIIIDLAAESGGNVEGTVAGQDVITENGVCIVGRPCLEGRVSQHATQMFAGNIANFLEYVWDKTTGVRLRTDDDIVKGCLLTHAGAIIHPQFRS